jgi:type VII secretion effector (TIGR04197 family)
MIQSLFQTAEDIANKMGCASDSIDRATSKIYTRATDTTLTVNGRAQDANEELIELAKAFNDTFKETIQQLHSVATEFERTDVELHDNIDKLLPLSKPFLKYNMK